MREVICLHSLNLKVNKGEFVCIIGDVGAGKSSLFSALIGDLRYLTYDFFMSNEKVKCDKKLQNEMAEESLKEPL